MVDIVSVLGLGFLFAGLMLIQDTIWSVSTKAIASNNTLLGAVFNSLGDGLGKAVSIASITIVAHSATMATSLAQIIGNMLGAFVGVFVGSHVSILLDRLFAGYHRHPAANPLGVFGTTGLGRKAGEALPKGKPVLS